MKIVAFFNNKGGVGKTSLVYHLAWMYRDLGLRVVAADLDPQANLTAAFLSEDQLEALWPDGHHPRTIRGCLEPLIKGVGDIAAPHLELVSDALGLVVGDIGLSTFEDELSQTWAQCLDRKERAFRVTSSFYRALVAAASSFNADVVLIDVGPNLGAINRSAMITAEHVVVPLAPDLFSLQGLKNLGPTLRTWRSEWGERKTRNPEPTLQLPSGEMTPAGYVVLQHAVRLDQPVAAYDRWMALIPGVYRGAVLSKAPAGKSTRDDPHCLASLKHYRALMPLAQAARKPIFHLKAADGALGAHARAVKSCGDDFRALARRIAAACKMPELRASA